MRKGFLALVGVGVVSVCMLFSFAACSFSLGEQGDVSSLVTSESAQTETSSEAASSEPSSRPSSLSDSVISNPFEGSSSMTASERLELSAEDKQKAYQLIERLKQKDISLLRYYNEITSSGVCDGKFDTQALKDATVIKTVTDKQQIKSFVNALSLDTWYPREQSIKTWPHWAVYIDEDFRIGIIGGRELRLVTKDESYCFEVPANVLGALQLDCMLIKNPDEQTASSLIEQLKQKEVSVLRYYEKSIYNPLIFHPHNEFEGAQYFRYVTDSEKIDQFIDLLRLDEWKTGNMRMTDSPLYHVYFDEDTYISVEDPSDDHFWVSIHSKEVSARYIVPREVYWELKDNIRARLYPRR